MQTRLCAILCEKEENMKTVIITGASKGIGREIFKLFGEKGYSVFGTKNLTESEDEGLVKCNLENEAEIKAFVEKAAKRTGRIDCIINCAGIAKNMVMQNLDTAEMDKMTAVNLKAPYIVIKHSLKYMLSGGGSIINISSVWGNEGASCEVWYSALKGGINAMTKALAQELAPQNIRVNAVAPGVIKTDMLSCYSTEDLKDLKERTPLNRLGSTKDIADAVYFLAESDFITGQILTVDGGFTL